MVFKKIFFECGAKEDSLYEGKCIKCYKGEFLPIKEIKETNFKICNQCSRIHYDSGLYTVDEIEEMLPSIINKRIILNPGYTLKNLSIDNFELKGNRLVFDINIDTELNEIR